MPRELLYPQIPEIGKEHDMEMIKLGKKWLIWELEYCCWSASKFDPAPARGLAQ